MENNNNEKIFFDKTRRIMTEQTVGFSKVLDAIREKYSVKRLSGDGEEIILIEKKDEK